jgi:hypothetical protein
MSIYRMLSTKKMRELNASLENGKVPKELLFYKGVGFTLDWSKLDYSVKERPRHPFDVYFESLFHEEN